MPNYSYTASSAFTPFTFEQLAAPAIMYDTAYKEVETGLNELANQAAVLDYIAKTNPEARSSQMYNQYMQNLDRAAEELSKNGLSKGSRSTLMGLRKAYAQNIIPIQQAYGRRGQLVDAVLEQKAKDNSLIFDRDPSTYTIDELMDNPTLTPRFYSGNTIRQQVGLAARNLQRDLRNYGLGMPIDEYTDTFIKNHGLSREQVFNALTNPNSSEGARILNAILNDVIGASGIDTWGNEAALVDAVEYGRQGFWDAIGPEDVSLRNKPIPKGGSGSGDLDVPTTGLLGSRTPVGAEGETNENLKYTEGLRNTGNGTYSTEILDKANTTISSLMNIGKFSDEDYKKLEQRAANIRAFSKLLENETIQDLIKQEISPKLSLSPDIGEQYQTIKRNFEKSKTFREEMAKQGFTNFDDIISDGLKYYLKKGVKWTNLAAEPIVDAVNTYAPGLSKIFNGIEGVVLSTDASHLLEALIDKQDSEEFLHNIQTDFDYLANSDYETVQTWNDLEDITEKSINNVYSLEMLPTAQKNNLKSVIKGTMTPFTSDEIRGDEAGATIGLYNVGTGEKMSDRKYKKFKEAKDDEIQIRLQKSPNSKNNGIAVVYDNDVYTIKNNGAFDKIRDDVNAVYAATRFTDPEYKNEYTRMATPEILSLQEYAVLDPMTYSAHRDLLRNAKPIKDVPDNLRIARYYIDTTNGRDLINILIDTTTGQVLFIQGMQDLLANGGQHSDETTHSMVNRTISALLKSSKTQE